MRTWEEAEREHAAIAREAVLDAGAEVMQLVETFEGLHDRSPGELEARRVATERQLERVIARLRTVEAASVTLHNIAAFCAHEPNHPGTP